MIIICRLFEQKTEWINFLVSGCLVLTQIEYEERHNKIEHHIYWKVCKHYGILNCEEWYNHQLEPVAEAKTGTILEDFSIQTDRKIKNNRSDIVVKDYKRKKTYLLIDMAVPTDNYISVIENDK